MPAGDYIGPFVGKTASSVSVCDCTASSALPHPLSRASPLLDDELCCGLCGDVHDVMVSVAVWMVVVVVVRGRWSLSLVCFCERKFSGAHSTTTPHQATKTSTLEYVHVMRLYTASSTSKQYIRYGVDSHGGTTYICPTAGHGALLNRVQSIGNERHHSIIIRETPRTPSGT